jgi:6,7-dimethyl-8-ribityllumazine synthase
MIKGITVTQTLADASQVACLVDLLATLGFEYGGDDHSFLVPVAKLELSGSRQLSEASRSLCIEVTGLDDIHVVADAWLREKTSVGSIGAIVDGAEKEMRSFFVEPIPGTFITFWEWSDPLRNQPVAVAGNLSAEGMRFAIVVARWNAVITDRLLLGALDALYRSGAKRAEVEIVRVPGAWEIPSAARKIAESGRFDAIVTLGLLLRGDTAHYEAIYNEVSRGIGQSQQETGIPHAFGVLTCETLEQALDRAGLKSGNKGFEAASAAIEMVSLHRKLPESLAAKCSRVQGHLR